MVCLSSTAKYLQVRFLVSLKASVFQWSRCPLGSSWQMLCFCWIRSTRGNWSSLQRLKPKRILQEEKQKESRSCWVLCDICFGIAPVLKKVCCCNDLVVWWDFFYLRTYRNPTIIIFESHPDPQRLKFLASFLDWGQTVLRYLRCCQPWRERDYAEKPSAKETRAPQIISLSGLGLLVFRGS